VAKESFKSLQLHFQQHENVPLPIKYLEDYDKQFRTWGDGVLDMVQSIKDKKMIKDDLTEDVKQNLMGTLKESQLLHSWETNIKIDPKQVKFGNVLGEGKIGKTFSGYCSGINVGIKKIPLISVNEEHIRSLEKSISKTRHISNHINPIIGMFSDEEGYYIVSNYEKRNLGNPQKALSTERKIAILVNLIETVNILTSHTIHHGNLHPRNVLLNETYEVKLSDIGYTLHLTTIPHPGEVGYMAPELYVDDRNKVNLEKCDVYYFGIIAIELICGANPLKGFTKETKDKIFQYFKSQTENGNHIYALPNNMSEVFGSLMKRCVDFDPSERPTIQVVKEHFLNPQFLNSFYGEVDDFWDSNYKDESGRQVPWLTLRDDFYKYFGDKKISPEEFFKQDDMKRKLSYLRHMLQISSDDGIVLRENYSLFCTLMKNVDGYKNKNLVEIFSFLETLYSTYSWWYGCISEVEAQNRINNMDIGTGATVLVYAPVHENGNVHVLVKISKIPMGKKFPIVEIIKITESTPISSRQFPIIFGIVEELKNKIKSDYKVTLIDNLKMHPGYWIDNSIDGVVSHYVSTYNFNKNKPSQYSSNI